MMFLFPFLFTNVVLGEVLERVIVKVNGEIITMTELQARQIAAIREAQVPYERIDAYLRENNQQILQEAIDDLLIAQHSADADGDVPEEQLNQAIEGIKKDFGIKNEEEFERSLDQEGMTREELKRNIARSILVRRFFMREVEPKVTVSDADSRAQYESRKAAEFTLPDSAELQEILIPTAKGIAAAREVVARLRAGEDFATLARSLSSSPTAAAGGQLGHVKRGDLNQQLAQAVAALAPGQVSEPLVTRAGFQILKLIGRSEERVVPFEEAKERILRELKHKQQEEIVQKIIAKMRNEATIQDMVREVPLQASSSSLSPAGGSSLLDAVSGAAAESAPKTPEKPALPDEEFSVTPMAKPQKTTASPAAPAAPPKAEPQGAGQQP